MKYVTLLLANFDPPPPFTFWYISRDPQKYVTHLGLPLIFSWPSTKTLTKAPCTNSLSIVHGFFCPGDFLLSVRVCPGCFLSVPLSVRMHVSQQKVKHRLKFHVSYV